MRITCKADGVPVLVVPGLAMPERVVVTAEDHHGYDVMVTAAVQAGRIVAEHVRVRQRPGGPAVTSEAIRSVPVATLTREAASLAQIVEDDGPSTVRITYPGPDPDLIRLMKAAGPAPDTLRAVAHIYRVAQALRQPPTKTIADTFGVAAPTASQWVARARQDGHLALPQKGR